MEEKITKNEVHLTNLRRIEDRTFEGQAITDFEIHVTDWDKVLEEHKIRLETETAERTARLQKQEAKQKSWQLYVECKTYLENNEKNWELRRIERETEMKKKQRLSKANEQREKLLEKVRERKLQEEISNKIMELPETERIKLEKEEERNRRQDIIETKKSLWKLRTKEKKYEKETEKVNRLKKQEEMQQKLITIEKILAEIKEEKRNSTEEKKKQQEMIDKEWRKKVKLKYEKEEKKRQLLEKQKQLSQHWGMLRWITEFIQENQEGWEKQKLEREKQAKEELEIWNKCKRLEKIEKLKEKWKKQDTENPQENPLTTKVETPVKTTIRENLVWREKQKENTSSPPKTAIGFDITSINQDKEIPEQPRYNIKEILKQAKLDSTKLPSVEPVTKKSIPGEKLNVSTVPPNEEKSNTSLSMEPQSKKLDISTVTTDNTSSLPKKSGSKKSKQDDNLNISTVPTDEVRENTSLPKRQCSKKLNVSTVPTKEKTQNTSLSEEPKSKKSKPKERLNVSTVPTDGDRNQKQMPKLTLTAPKIGDKPIKTRNEKKQDPKIQTNNITNYFSRTKTTKDIEKTVLKNECAQAHLPKIVKDPSENTELGLAGRDIGVLVSEINTSQALGNFKKSDLTTKLSLTNNLLEDSEDQVTC